MIERRCPSRGWSPQRWTVSGRSGGAVINGLIAFIDSDLLCYRAEYPAALKARQNGVWQPVLDWLRDEHRIQFAVVEGVIPTPQSAETALALRTKIESFDDEALTAFQACAAATKSLALSMALVHGHLSAAEVAASAHLDEFYQMDQWGEDREALIRLRVIKSEIHAIGRYSWPLGPGRTAPVIWFSLISRAAWALRARLLQCYGA